MSLYVMWLNMRFKKKEKNSCKEKIRQFRPDGINSSLMNFDHSVDLDILYDIAVSGISQQ